MTTYRYKGQTVDGAKVSGVIRAYDEFEAVAKLRDTCAFVTKLEEVKEKKSAFSVGTHVRIKEKELALICSQFSIILGTGLPVMRCVEMVASQSRNKRTRRMLEKVAEDIGAGYSSLSDLSTYPIDGVKIDRSIVIESALPRARALLEGMIRLSHDMGIRVLCEGVEDKATCDAVLAAGCDFIQGFYFSRVLPGREAESFLRSLAARDREEG